MPRCSISKVYEKFINDQISIHGNIAFLKFRDKDFGGWNHSTTIEFYNGEKYNRTRSHCSYLKAFLNLASVRQILRLL